MPKPLRKQTGKLTSGSVVDKKKPGGILPPELVRMVKYASYLGDGYILFKVDTGKEVATKTTKPTERATIRKIPGFPLITKRDICAIATRLGYDSPAISSGARRIQTK